MPETETVPAQPVAFEGLFGWHSPGRTGRGVILCGTHGYEQLSAHRGWRALAERIAGTGCTVLRFDYPGQGDSGDVAVERLEDALGAIRAAIRFLRADPGIEEIALVGLRLGGTLAAQVAAETGGVDRLVLIAPFAAGRTFLREMKILSRTTGVLPDGTPLPQEPEGLTVAAFRIGPALSEDLGGLDLAKLTRAPAPRILLLGGEGGALPKRFAALGAQVETRSFPELPDLVSNPLYAKVPEAAFAAVAAFLSEGAAPRLRPAAPAREAVLAGPGWSERPARFGPGLFGLACAPETPLPRAPVVLFVNAGTNVHSGWGRSTTRLARRLAGIGVASLRMDLGGIGDSAPRASSVFPIYADETLDDVTAALDHLGRPAVIFGACSGANLGFHATCRDPRIAAAILVNLQRFDWDKTQDIEVAMRNVYRSTGTYAAMLKQGAAWKRLVRGEVRVGPILASLARRGFEAVQRRIAPLVNPPPGGSVKRRVAAIRRRGSLIQLVYSQGDVGLADLALQLGRQADARLGRPVTVIPEADHDLSTRAAQETLYGLVSGLLRDLAAAPLPSSEGARGAAPVAYGRVAPAR